MVKAIPWVLAGFCAAHLISLIAIYLSIGRIEVEDVSW
jgi:hypothetical protein